MFWKTIKPLFSDKSTNTKQIVLNHGDNIISNEKEVAETLNTFFRESVRNLGIVENEVLPNIIPDDNDCIDKIISRFESHPSILKIRDKVVNTNHFSFSKIGLNDIVKELHGLNCNKAITFKNIPIKDMFFFKWSNFQSNKITKTMKTSLIP